MATTKKQLARSKKSVATISKAPRRKVNWANASDEKLLDTRICDLDLDLEKSWIWPRVEKLYGELEQRGIKFRPHVWLSDDWYAPDGIPGIAVPFYLAHPRLKKLERKMMLEVEGGTIQWCMRILRHEAGHALDTAFGLHRKKSYRSVFGNYNDPYPETYRPKPNSKRYVLHLEPWYAQSHPAEDFAETFAVWLTPRRPWRTEYKGWPALKKVEYVDTLMNEVGGQPAKKKSRAKTSPVHRIRKTLREHYASRHAEYNVECSTAFDHDLQKLFGDSVDAKSRSRMAAAFLQRHRNELCRMVSTWTGQYRYNVNQVLREMIERCRALKLRVDPKNEAETKHNAMVMLTVHTMNYLHGGHHHIAL